MRVPNFCHSLILVVILYTDLQPQNYFEKVYTYGLNYIKNFLSVLVSLIFEPPTAS